MSNSKSVLRTKLISLSILSVFARDGSLRLRQKCLSFTLGSRIWSGSGLRDNETLGVSSLGGTTKRNCSSLMKNQNNPLNHKWETGVCLVERIVSLEIEKTYASLKAVLLEKNCRIIAEEAPKLISVRQGSLWGVYPVAAKKVVNYRLAPVNSGTRITGSSSLASDWKNLTIIGCVVSLVVVALCLWMAMDLDTLVATRQQGYWSWIASVEGYVDVQTAEMFADLTRTFAVFLATILAAEVAIVVYVQSKINTFAEETFNAL